MDGGILSQEPSTHGSRIGTSGLQAGEDVSKADQYDLSQLPYID